MLLANDRDAGLDPASADWFAWLPAVSQAECRAEISELLTAGLAPGDLDYDSAWWGWCATAEIHTDPRLLAALRRDHLGDGGLVSRPELS